ncbi:unnamed protein product [Cochlearia groenlandica]
MASNACKVLCLVLFLAFTTHVKQSKTGKLVQNKPEWEVRVTNPCQCRFQYTSLSCPGFNSVTPVPTSLVSKSGDSCLLNAGKFIVPHVDFVFKYVWDTNFDLKVQDGVIVCP